MQRIRTVYRWLPIASLILLFAFFTLGSNADEITIPSILANSPLFDGKSVIIQRTAAAVKETVSRAGNTYQTANLNPTSITYWHDTLSGGGPYDPGDLNPNSMSGGDFVPFNFKTVALP